MQIMHDLQDPFSVASQFAAASKSHSSRSHQRVQNRPHPPRSTHVLSLKVCSDGLRHPYNHAFDVELPCHCVSHMSREKMLPHADPEASCQIGTM